MSFDPFELSYPNVPDSLTLADREVHPYGLLWGKQQLGFFNESGERRYFRRMRVKANHCTVSTADHET